MLLTQLDNIQGMCPLMNTEDALWYGLSDYISSDNIEFKHSEDDYTKAICETTWNHFTIRNLY